MPNKLLYTFSRLRLFTEIQIYKNSKCQLCKFLCKFLSTTASRPLHYFG